MLCVLGELVVDLIPDSAAGTGPEGTAPHFVARPGGNALNVAVAAGRLGTPVALLSRLGRGPLAPHLRRHAELSDVDVRGMVEAPEPVSLAVVGLAPDGSADYGFHVVGAADWQWTDQELADVFPVATTVLHVGSISSWTAPGCQAIADLAERLHRDGSALVSVDPNIRPMLAEGFGNTAEDVRARIDRLVATADIVKVSSEDLEWLGLGPEEALEDWLGRGPAVVAVTLGGDGVLAGTPAGLRTRRPGVPVEVVDTVGAGDSFSAALLAGMHRRDLLGAARRPGLRALDGPALDALLDEAAAAAAITCSRRGADPPTAAELAARAGR